MDLKALVAAIDDRMNEKAGIVDVPDGWHTTKQWCKMWGRSDRKTREMLRQACADGLMERKIFKVLNVNGEARDIPHFAVAE